MPEVKWTIDKLKKMKFGRLLVLEEAERTHPRLRRVLCKCDCGMIKTFCLKDLYKKTGHRTVSCGCYLKEIRGKGRISHGCSMPHSKFYREYQVYKAMLRRCFYKKDKHYMDYAGRGITVCQKWRKDFSKFIEDLGPCPSGHSLDRINNDGDYKPSNCRWANKFQQAMNKRNVRYFTFNGVTKPGFQWADENGTKRSTYRQRLSQGYSLKEAIFGKQRS